MSLIFMAQEGFPVPPGFVLTVTVSMNPLNNCYDEAVLNANFGLGESVASGLLAHEYGKPCIADIENATSIFEDGQVVEMDGSNGVVRLKEKKMEL